MSRYALALVLAVPGLALADMDVQISLNWLAPTENVDGSPLTDLNRYTVYWGYASGDYTNAFDVLDPLATTTAFDALGVQSGQTIFVAMTAWDDDDNQSNYSNEVSFGPFLEGDTVFPVIGTGLTGSATIIRCGNDSCSVGQ